MPGSARGAGDAPGHDDDEFVLPRVAVPCHGRQWPSGKIDNTYSTFEAGGRKWMVLTLEVWPRTEAIAWAKNVVAAHPDHNVIVATHSFLTADGSIYRGNEGYGANTAALSLRQLGSAVSEHPLDACPGTPAIAASRLDMGDRGNTVASFLGAFHSNTTNPIQFIEIDTAANTVKHPLLRTVEQAGVARVSRGRCAGWPGWADEPRDEADRPQ